MPKKLSYLAAAGAALAVMATLPVAASANIHMPASAKPATAAATVTLTPESGSTGIWNVSYPGKESYRGKIFWNADPGRDLDGNGRPDPGDSIAALDGYGDGWGVKAVLSTGRVATTKGHSAPYWSGWATGNLPENRTYTLKGCVFKGSTEHCSAGVKVTS